MDVNEEIIVEWLHICKNQFTIDNIPFKVYGPKGGSNYSNIDILAADNNNKFYDYEIKWRSVYSLSTTDLEDPEALLHQLSRRERRARIGGIIGKKAYKKVFITTHQFFGKSVEKRQKFVKFFNKNDVEVKFFEDIIDELVNKIEIKGRYDSPVLQVIRIFKLFELLKQKSP